MTTDPLQRTKRLDSHRAEPLHGGDHVVSGVGLSDFLLFDRLTR
jgi:hypothetical protein